MHRKCYACARYMHVYCGPVLHGSSYIYSYANSADYIQLVNQCLYAASYCSHYSNNYIYYVDSLHD